MNYPGGKSGAGVYQTIINQIPPHKRYIEGYLGGGAIFRKKLPALVNIGVDLDQELIATWSARYPLRDSDNKCYAFYALPFLELLARIDNSNYAAAETFIYLDPPYLHETRKSQYPIYQHEMSRTDHEQLLTAIQGRAELIMISGYRAALYDQMLSGWRSLDFPAMTRGGRLATETIWMNYPQPIRLHDWRYFGENFTDRQRIKRKAARLKNKLLNLPPGERAYLLHTIDDIEIYDYETG